MDKLFLILVIGLISMGIGITCLASIGFRSIASPTLVLATTTMVSAIVFFSLQLWFELRSTVTDSVFGTTVTIDHSRPNIWHSKKHHSDIVRRSIEERVGNWLAQHKGELFAQLGGDKAYNNADKVARDLILYSMLVYIAYNEPSWNLDSVSLRTNFGTLKQIPRGSTDKNCTNVDKERIHRLLSMAGNVFSGAEPSPFDPLSLCFPPDTLLSLTAGDLILENPFCRISFHLEEPTAFLFNSNSEPDSGTPLTPNGQGRFESRIIGVRIHIEHFRLRSQHADSAKYRAWSERLVRGIQRWLESAQEPA